MATTMAAATTSTGGTAAPGGRDLHQLLLAPTVDWRHFQQRLDAQPDEARVLNAQGWSVLQAMLARKSAASGKSNDYCNNNQAGPLSSSSCSLRQAAQRHSQIRTNGSLLSCTVLSTRSLLRLVEHLLAIFPEAAWMGIDSYTSPLHLVCRYHAHLLSSQLLTLLLEQARPTTVLPYDQRALVDLWEHHMRELGEGKPERLVAILSHYMGNSGKNKMSILEGLSVDDRVEIETICSKREARGIYLQLMKLLHYLTGAPVVKEHHDDDEEDDDDDEECCWTSVNSCFLNPSTFLHRVAALTVDLDILRLALSMNSTGAGAHQVDCTNHNRLPMHCFLSNPPHERPPDDFDCFFDLHPLFDLLHQANRQAISTCDAQGYLPLHIAIQAGWKDELVMDRLIYHYPESLECPVTIQLNNPNQDQNDDDDEDDDKNACSSATTTTSATTSSLSVLPFQLAALTPESSLTTVYRLVRQDPRIAVAAFGSTSSSPKLGSPTPPCQFVPQEASKHAFHQEIPPPPVTAAPLTTKVLSQFVRAVGATHNVRLWRSMKVLLTTPTTTTATTTPSIMTTTSPLKRVVYEKGDDPLELLQQHLSTIASQQRVDA